MHKECLCSIHPTKYSNGLWALDLGLWILGFECKVLGLGSWVLGFGFCIKFRMKFLLAGSEVSATKFGQVFVYKVLRLSAMGSLWI